MTTAPFDITQAMQDSHPHFQPTLQSRNERKNMDDSERSDLDDLRSAIGAHLEGKPVEFRGNGDNWTETPFPTFSSLYKWRPKPQPKTRPWSKPEDVPGPVCWIRCVDVVGMLVTGFLADGSGVICMNSIYLWEEFPRRNFEHSTTRLPDSWHPCEVTEGEG